MYYLHPKRHRNENRKATIIKICVENSLLSDGAPVKTIHIQTENYELSVYLKPEEFQELSTLLAAGWESGALTAGMCANSRVIWLRDGNMINILIGSDERSWDFGVSLPYYMLEKRITSVD